jgi:ABC-2 type transport system permease protein
MFRTVYLKSLYDARRGLLGWSAAIVALVLVECALWPAVRDLRGPNTGTGFLNDQLFTLVLPALFVAYGVGHGARTLAGEAERGTLELLFATPVSGARIVCDKALALASSVALLGLAVFAATTAGSEIFALGITAADAAGGALATTLLGLEYGVLALTVGALTGRRSAAVGVAAAAATAAYLVHTAGDAVPRLASWQPYSPVHQAIGDGPLGAGFQLSYLWLLAGAAGLLIVALPALDGRDISTSS